MRLGLISFPFFGCTFFLLFLTGIGADDFAIGIEHFEFYGLLGLVFQVVVEQSPVRRIFTNGGTATGRAAETRSKGGAGSKKMRVLGSDGSAGLAERA